MCGQAFSGVAYERFTEITNGSHQTKTTDVATWMSHHAIRTRRHALDFPTLRARGGFRIAATEIAKGSVLLCPAAEITGHGLIARMLPQIHHILLVRNLLLPYAHPLGLLPSSGLPFRHLAGLKSSSNYLGQTQHLPTKKSKCSKFSSYGNN